MRLNRLAMVAALVLLSPLAGCSSFEYRRYVINEQLVLLANEEDGSMDRPVSDCFLYNEDGSYKGSNCFVFFGDEFQRLRNDYLSCQRKLRRIR